jgi:endonuclease-8
MPEGDTVHRVARRLQLLVGEPVSAEARHPRAAVTGVAERVDGRRLVAVEAKGKNLLLHFEGAVLVRNHLRMSGSWHVLAPNASVVGMPWLVLRTPKATAVLRGGAVLELSARHGQSVGPDILEDPPHLERMVENLRRADAGRELGEALLDQRLVAGIGNIWRAESLWSARLSPWHPLSRLTDADRQAVLAECSRLMRLSLDGRAEGRAVYRRTGRPCRRCGSPIRSRRQGDANRVTYWCPQCQDAGGGGADA